MAGSPIREWTSCMPCSLAPSPFQGGERTSETDMDIGNEMREEILHTLCLYSDVYTGLPMTGCPYTRLPGSALGICGRARTGRGLRGQETQRGCYLHTTAAGPKLLLLAGRYSAPRTNTS